MDPWKRRLLLETIIFRGYVSFREGNHNGTSQNQGPLMGISVHPWSNPLINGRPNGLFWGLDLIKSHSYPSSSSLFNPPDLVDNGDNEEARGAWFFEGLTKKIWMKYPGCTSPSSDKKITEISWLEIQNNHRFLDCYEGLSVFQHRNFLVDLLYFPKTSDI